jgi:hydroxymethylglutaryl-CoA reductase (NADPH)
MRLLGECGGVRTTVVDDHMQRAPAFLFEHALEAREFGRWVDEHLEDIRKAAEATTGSGKADLHRPAPDRQPALPAGQLHDR